MQMGSRSQLVFPFEGLSPVQQAVEVRATAGVESRGVIYMRQEVVDFILDLVGTAAKPLHELSSLKTFVTSFAGHIAAEAAR
jgi:hypothetical protein